MKLKKKDVLPQRIKLWFWRYIRESKKKILGFAVVFCWSFSLSKQTEHMETHGNS